jgi:NADH dehydrogenase (ubiquinone) 1 beta subcomplex subunit 9
MLERTSTTDRPRSPIASVQHLYRRALKSALDWTIQRPIWREKAIEIRVQFERNRDVKDPRAVARLLQQAEETVAALEHPDPYRRE